MSTMVLGKTLLMLCLALGVASDLSDWPERRLDSLSIILNHINLDELITSVEKIAHRKSISIDLGDEIKKEHVEHQELQGQNCPTCRTALATLKTLIRNGATFEDVRDEAIAICLSVSNGMGYIGEVMCPGIIDNFGPEVVYVLDETDEDYSAADICRLYRKCETRLNNKEAYMQPHQKTYPKKEKVQHDYNNMLRVVHVTDIHVDQEYMEGGPSFCNLPLCCRGDQNGTSPAEYWGNYQCGVPAHTVESFLRQVAEEYDPHIIFYTGDSPPHAIWLETQWGQIDDSRYISETLAKIFPGVPAYTAMGNHDTYPVNMYGRNRPELLTEELNEALAGYWGPLSRFEAEQYATFEYGGYYSILAQPGLRVISYNSNYGTAENFFWLMPLESGEIVEMMSFIEAEFEKARNNDERVILLGHHSTGSRGYFEMWESFMYDITNRYGDVIILHFLGHTHSDIMKMTVDRETGEARNVWLCPGAVVPYTNQNPSGKIFYIDPDTFDPIDFDTVRFNFNTSLSNPEKEPELELWYRASEEYGLADLSPESYANFVERMETDDDLFYRYRYNEAAGARWPGTCEGSCKTGALCGMKSITVQDYENCVRRGAIN